MTILALEFSSQQRSAAVARGRAVLAEVIQVGERNTAVFEIIEDVLAQAGIARGRIEALAVGLGPGSYTGVRASVAAVQGWQLARGTKTTGVSSVAAIAAQAQAEKIFGRVNVVVNAQREEFYLAVYDIAEGATREAEPLRISPRAHVQSLVNEGCILAGPDAAGFFPNGAKVRTVYPRASAISVLAAAQNSFLPAENLTPIYLRETNFTRAKPPRNPSGN